MVASAPFKRVLARVTQMLERARTECERESDAAKLHYAQGQIAAYRAVLTLPEVLKTEIARAKS